ncbi:rod shape-determining protein [[Acholeplasma] multilocale]|uniref:rod shape-determining protein n=1 Tax=[Acholeplasma] multilocale TaxID=264638 RepID=UPI00047C77A9|nr:rod shape-determining protein [[Acholeplasma] multilocale]
MSGKKIGIIFGGEYTRIISTTDGMIYDDLSLVCWNDLTTEVVVMGKDAKKMIDRVDKPLRVIAPLENETIQNLEVFKSMVEQLLNKFKNEVKDAEVVISAPTIHTEQVQQIMDELLAPYGMEEIHYVPKLILAALGGNIKTDDEYGSILLDLGHYKAEVAVIADDELITITSSDIAERELDKKIVLYLKEEYSLLIEEDTLEKIKWSLGSVIKLRDELELQLPGRDMITNARKTVVVKDGDFKKIFIQLFTTYKGMITTALEQSPMYIRTGIVKNGLTITGELSGIIGVKDFFQDFFDFPTRTSKARGYATTEGVIKYFNKL